MKWFGKTDKDSSGDEELELLEQSIYQAQMPPQVQNVALRELERIEKIHPSTAEFTIGLNYLDYLIGLPWDRHSEDHLDLARAETILDAAHFGLEGVKERILEYLAVLTLNAQRKMRVLVAEDEEVGRRNLERFLTREGYLVKTAPSGEAALDLLAREEFDIVLTDIKMGRVNGIQVLEQTKCAKPETQVVVMTGYSSVDSAVEIMKKGAFHYLTKPFKLDEVRSTLKQIEEKKQPLHKVRGPILCLVGPPGTGKTSLARSIAQALERKFIRVSLAGMKDEAELRGHRRTYAGAMPGRIIQEIRRAEANNPIFLLDEMDKVIQSFKGDPTAALLEVLDPEQNVAFIDYYLDVPFDLSRVLFITTANIVDPIPPALLDRMEVLTLSGYTDGEKVKIAQQAIIPRQIRENGLQDSTPTFSDEAVIQIIHDYTREAGLRNLEREIARVCRKLARRLLACGEEEQPAVITPDSVKTYLGPRRFQNQVTDAVDRVGVTTGLVWTENGGQIIFVEATIMRGRSELILTGSLGEVMRESAQAALSYLRANSEKYGLPEDFFRGKDIHIHVPAGAIPKDGPSAGFTIAMSLLSLLTNRPARRDLALTGEMTLSGRLLPVGGIKEKLLAANRAGVKTVVLPDKNRVDFDNLSPEVYQGLEVLFADSLLKVVERALRPPVENGRELFSI